MEARVYYVQESFKVSLLSFLFLSNLKVCSYLYFEFFLDDFFDDLVSFDSRFFIAGKNLDLCSLFKLDTDRSSPAVLWFLLFPESAYHLFGLLKAYGILTGVVLVVFDLMGDFCCS